MERKKIWLQDWKNQSQMKMYDIHVLRGLLKLKDQEGRQNQNQLQQTHQMDWKPFMRMLYGKSSFHKMYLLPSPKIHLFQSTKQGHQPSLVKMLTLSQSSTTLLKHGTSLSLQEEQLHLSIIAGVVWKGMLTAIQLLKQYQDWEGRWVLSSNRNTNCLHTQNHGNSLKYSFHYMETTMSQVSVDSALNKWRIGQISRHHSQGREIGSTSKIGDHLVRKK